jgi:hypothetical protein
MEEVKDRIRKYFDESDGCWEWTGSLNEKGYGLFCFKGKTRRAHRVIYEITYGPIPFGLMVTHLCDNRRCVNPSHLELGTARTNAWDAITRGRFKFSRITDRRKCKLTDKEVLEIRSLYHSMPDRELAARYGVHRTTVRYEVERRLLKEGK